MVAAGHQLEARRAGGRRRRFGRMDVPARCHRTGPAQDGASARHHARVGYREFVRLVQLHEIKPVVGKVFDFENTKEADVCLEKQDFVGKVVIRVAKE